jgi:hypothetical protein
MDRDGTGGTRRAGPRSHGERHAAQDRGWRHEAVLWPRRLRHAALDPRPYRHPPARPGRIGPDRARRHAPRRGRGAAREPRPAVAVRAATLRSGRNPRWNGRLRARRPGTRLGRAVARLRAGRTRAYRRRPGVALRRRGDEERRGLRRRAADGRLARHPRDPARRLTEGAAAAGRRTHAGARDGRGRRARLSCRAGARRPALTAGSWIDGRLYLRFEGSAATLDDIGQRIGGEVVPDAGALWTSLREQTHPFFAGQQPLWRCALPPLAHSLAVGGAPLIEWNGLQRWYRCDGDVTPVDAAAAAGGHATLFRHASVAADVFAPLAPPLMRVHRELKRAFDPAGILNPGRMYADL